MAQRRSNNSNNNQPTSTSWFDLTIGKISTIGGAIIVLFTVGGGAYQVGRTFKENEKNLEVFDLKLKNEKEKDSLRTAIKELQNEINLLKQRRAK